MVRMWQLGRNMGYLRLTAPGNVASYDSSILRIDDESQPLDAVYGFHIFTFKVAKSSYP